MLFRSNKVYYFSCTFNSLQNYYIEVLTNTDIKADENIDVCHLPTFLSELHLNYIGYLNYYELIYLYNKLRNLSGANLEDKHNGIESDKRK